MHHSEKERLRSPADYQIVDTPSDRLTELARKTFDAPVALVSLVVPYRQWF